MYESHWNLAERPFEAKANENSYYPSESHQAAALKLGYAIEQRRAIAVLCGESGLGKTMILESCLEQLADSFSPIARVVYPAMPSEQLIQHIARQIGPQEKGSLSDLARSIEFLDRVLRHNVAQNLHAVVAIDEAHLLSQFGSLEGVRLLLNLASDSCLHESPITLVLCGATSIISQLAKSSSLEDRISVRCVLERFSLDDTTAYIQHRMRQAGTDRDDIFSAAAIETVQLLSMGVPRRINRLCDLALMIGFAQDLQQIDPRTIENAHRELSSVRHAA
ncbi:ExeA family protein [Pirellulaceae bacterium SH467]|jgi:general secretion pathway protein A